MLLIYLLSALPCTFSLTQSPLPSFYTAEQTPTQSLALTQSSQPIQSPTPLQSILSFATPTPIYNTLAFQIGAPVITGGLIICIIIINLVCRHTPKKPLTVIANPVINPVINHVNKPKMDHIIENGIKYYYDGTTDKILAAGWQKVTEGNETWYENTNGEPSSWRPVYR